jgi:hypothetical protein
MTKSGGEPTGKEKGNKPEDESTHRLKRKPPGKHIYMANMSQAKPN